MVSIEPHGVVRFHDAATGRTMLADTAHWDNVHVAAAWALHTGDGVLVFADDRYTVGLVASTAPVPSCSNDATPTSTSPSDLTTSIVFLIGGGLPG